MKIQREHWFQMPWFEDHMMPNLVHTNNHNILNVFRYACHEAFGGFPDQSKLNGM